MRGAMTQGRGPRITQGRSSRRWSWALQLLGACLVLVGAVATIDQARAQEAFPLDKYPGFGRSAEAALRDDTIAYWEAFRREQSIASCMRASRFEYSPAVAYPFEAMLAVAEGLGVRRNTASPADLVPAVDRNAAYEAALPADERERFNQALFGESAADIAESNRTGQIPEGRDPDFRRGGCFGQGEASAPSIWELRRELDDALIAMHRSVADSPELGATRTEFRACAQRVGGLAADSPADVDAIAARGDSDGTAAATVMEECDAVWIAGYRQAELAVAERFVESHEASLTALEAQYQSAMETIRSDQDFLTYLSEQAALAALSREAPDLH